MDNINIIRIKRLNQTTIESNKKYLRVGTKWKLKAHGVAIYVKIFAIKNDMVVVSPEFKGLKGGPKLIKVDAFLNTHKPTKRTIKQVEAELKRDLECKEPNTKVEFYTMLGLLCKCPDLVAYRATLNPDDTIYIENVDGKQELWIATRDRNSSVIRRRYTPHQADMFADDWIVTRGA